MFTTTNIGSAKYRVKIHGEVEFEGSFADAVTEYLQATKRAAKYVEDNPRLMSCAMREPIAQLEQTMVALWSTVPKHPFNEDYSEVIDAISAVIDFFESGDRLSFEEAFADAPDLDASSPSTILEVFELYLHDYFLPPEEINRVLNEFNEPDFDEEDEDMDPEAFTPEELATMFESIDEDGTDIQETTWVDDDGFVAYSSYSRVQDERDEDEYSDAYARALAEAYD